MDTMQVVFEKLREIPGVAGCWVLPDEGRKLLLQLENESNRRTNIPGIIIENEGIKDVLRRHHIVAISHSPALRHPPGPVVVLCDEKRIIGEEVPDTTQLKKISADRNVILLGTSLVLYRDRLNEARGKQLKLAYRALRFPELEKLDGIESVVSVTVGMEAHKWLVQRTGWRLDDSNLGTVLIGFNESNTQSSPEEPTKKKPESEANA